MSVHQSGDGAAWAALETLDVDQPHGLDYREFVHLAIAVRKRLEQEHVSFADSTVGGIHKPGGAAVLGICDGTPGAADGTYRGHGIVWDNTAQLWCSTATAGASTSGDFTVVLLHPDKQWGGADVTWNGAHEFDGSVDITGPFNVDGSSDFSDVAVTGDLSVAGIIKTATDISVTGDLCVDGTATITGDFFVGADMSIDGTSDFGGAVAFGSDVSIDGNVAIDGTVAGIFKFDGATVLRAAANFAAANTWEDLDASGVVGANRAILILRIEGGGDIYVAAREKIDANGETAWGSDDSFTHGAHHCKLSANGDIGTIITATDSAGVCQIAGHTNGVTVAVTLLGYIR